MRYHKVTPYIFILPMLLGLILFRFGPILGSLAISFTRWRGTSSPTYIGMGNYTEALTSDVFWEVMNNTLLFALLFVPGTMLLGLVLALLVNQPLRGIDFFRGIYYLPAITSMVAVALVWNWIFASRFGILNYILRTVFAVSDPPRWVSDSSTALFVLIIVSVWKSAGLPMMVYLAGLKGIPQSLYESAKIDGAGAWQLLRYVTLPMLTPVTFFVLIITLFEAFGTFEVTFAMTGGGPLNASTTLPFYIYQNSFQFARYGFASSLAYVLMIVVVILTVINFWARDRWVTQVN